MEVDKVNDEERNLFEIGDNKWKLLLCVQRGKWKSKDRLVENVFGEWNWQKGGGDFAKKR